jgi:hypothetical protein
MTGPSEDKPDDAAVDWDSDWKSFQKEGPTLREEVPSGNVFKLPGENRPGLRELDVDERTKNLTSAWTSEFGYLVGIAVIAVVALLEGYLWWQSQA